MEILTEDTYKLVITTLSNRIIELQRELKHAQETFLRYSSTELERAQVQISLLMNEVQDLKFENHNLKWDGKQKYDHPDLVVSEKYETNNPDSVVSELKEETQSEDDIPF